MRRLVRLTATALALLILAPALAEVSEKRFNKALRKYDLEKLERYLQRGVPDHLKREALEWAMKRRSKKTIVLLSRYVTPDEKMMNLALQAGDEEMITTLAEAGGRFTRKQTLWRLIEKKNERLALAVLKAGVGLHEPEAVIGAREVSRADGILTLEKYEEPHGMSPLFLAFEADLYDLGRKLIEAGADPGIVVHERPGRVKGVDLSTMKVGERFTRETSSPTGYRSPFRATALVNAVRDRDGQAVEILLAAGAPVAIAGDSRDLDACFFALKGWNERPDLVLRLCPWYDLHIATRNESVEQIEAALARGIDVNASDYDHRTALHIASYYGNVEVIDLLLRHGALCEPPIGPLGDPPLHEAIRQGHRDAIQALIAGGAGINTPDGQGNHAIHRARDVKTLELVLELGADIHAKNQYGNNALEAANQGNALEIVDILRRRGLGHGADLVQADGDLATSDKTSFKGHTKELLLTKVDKGRISLRGKLIGNRITEISCKLSDLVRDARYFYAPELIHGKKLPKMRPLMSLSDEQLAKYEGTIVRAGALNGNCTWLALPSQKRDVVATRAQLEAAMKGAEVRGNILQVLTTGRASTVFPGTLKSLDDDVVLVEVEGGLRIRCKLHTKTQGITFGLASMLERSMMGDPNAKLSSVTKKEDIRRHVGKKVKVGPGTGRCEYFELIGRK